MPLNPIASDPLTAPPRIDLLAGIVRTLVLLVLAAVIAMIPRDGSDPALAWALIPYVLIAAAVAALGRIPVFRSAALAAIPLITLLLLNRRRDGWYFGSDEGFSDARFPEVAVPFIYGTALVAAVALRSQRWARFAAPVVMTAAALRLGGGLLSAFHGFYRTTAFEHALSDITYHGLLAGLLLLNLGARDRRYFRYPALLAAITAAVAAASLDFADPPLNLTDFLNGPRPSLLQQVATILTAFAAWGAFVNTLLMLQASRLVRAAAFAAITLATLALFAWIAYVLLLMNLFGPALVAGMHSLPADALLAATLALGFALAALLLAALQRPQRSPFPIDALSAQCPNCALWEHRPSPGQCSRCGEMIVLHAETSLPNSSRSRFQLPWLAAATVLLLAFFAGRILATLPYQLQEASEILNLFAACTLALAAPALVPQSPPLAHPRRPPDPRPPLVGSPLFPRV